MLLDLLFSNSGLGPKTLAVGLILFRNPQNTNTGIYKEAEYTHWIVSYLGRNTFDQS